MFLITSSPPVLFYTRHIYIYKYISALHTIYVCIHSHATPRHIPVRRIIISEQNIRLHSVLNFGQLRVLKTTVAEWIVDGRFRGRKYKLLCNSIRKCIYIRKCTSIKECTFSVASGILDKPLQIYTLGSSRRKATLLFTLYGKGRRKKYRYLFFMDFPYPTFYL